MTECCPTCGRATTEGEKLFEGFMARMFLNIVKKSVTRQVTWKVDFPEKGSETKTEVLDNVIFAAEVKGTNEYARLSDLKFWKLLSQREEWFHQGIYQLSDLGIQFFLGHAKIPKRLYTRNGKPVKFADEQISFRDALGSRWNENEDWILDWCRQNDNTDGPKQRELPF